MTVPPPFLVPIGLGTAAAGVVDTFSWHVHDFDGHILDYNFFPSDSFVRMNPGMSVYELITIGLDEGVRNPVSIADHLTFCRGEIILSEQHPLGDLQAHLPGWQHQEVGAPMVLSDTGALSDYEWGLIRVPIDEWQESTTALGAPDPFDYGTWSAPAYSQAMFAFAQRDVDGTLSIIQHDTLSYSLRTYPRPWTGAWDTRTWADNRLPDPQMSGVVKTYEGPQLIIESGDGMLHEGLIKTENLGYLRV